MWDGKKKKLYKKKKKLNNFLNIKKKGKSCERI